MPDKSQNITINYKFNTAELAPAEALLKRTNDASNRLQQAGVKAGSAISQEFQKSNKTILDMQTALTRLKSIIEVTSNPGKLKQLSAEYKNLKTQLDAATKSAYGLDTALKQQGQGAQSLRGQFGSLITGVKAFIGLQLAQKIASTTLEMARLAGNTEGVDRAFKRAFPDAANILIQLKTATKGTVSEFELMQRTLQATNLGVSVRELPTLFEFAAARAQQTGESVDYLVDSIVRGIGRKSPLILDNLGLSAIRLKQKFDGVALASLSVAEVTRGVGEIAREELGKMGGFAETAATKVDKLTVAWEAVKTSFSQRVNSSGIIDFFSNFFTGLANTFEGRTAQLIEVAKTEGVRLAQTVLQGETLKSFKDNQQAKTDFLQQEINTRVQIEGQYNDQVSRFSAELLQIEAKAGRDRTLADNKRADFLEQQITKFKLLVLTTREARITLKAYLDELNKPAEVVSSGIIERKKEEIKQLQDQIEKTNNILDLGPTRLNKSGEIIQGKLIAKLEIAQAELGDLQRGFIEFKAIEFENNINDAAQSLSNFASVSERVKEDIMNGIEGTVLPAPDSVYTPDNWQKLKDDFVENWRDITSAGIDIQADQLKSIAELELTNMQQRLTNLQEFYANQQSLAGDNERAKEQLRLREQRETTKLRNEIARKEKQVRRTQVLIDIAAGIAKAFATYIWPYSLIPAAFVAAQGASQLAIINRQPTNFAKGVIDLKGPGTATSDSIPANLSRGESVMTAWETKFAGDVLRDVRAKKLDNRKLREMKEGRAPVQSQRFDDKNIIKAIKDQKHPDIVKASNIVYESKQYNEDYKKRVRSSSMSI